MSERIPIAELRKLGVWETGGFERACVPVEQATLNALVEAVEAARDNGIDSGYLPDENDDPRMFTAAELRLAEKLRRFDFGDKA